MGEEELALHGHWELNLGPLESQQVLLTSEPLLQPLHCSLTEEAVLTASLPYPL